jgi:hypothetical protein
MKISRDRSGVVARAAPALQTRNDVSNIKSKEKKNAA